MAVVSMKQLLESGVHFGHQTRRWNPKMARYIYTKRNGIHIIDLQQTVTYIDDAYNRLLEIAKDGGKLLFVGTKKQANDAIVDNATRANQFYVSKRWLGGTLTNFKTIRKSIRRLHQINQWEKDGTFDRLPKKEVVDLRKELARLEMFLGGIKEMRTLPDAVFIVDPRKENNAIKEARKLKIPIFGMVDTNCDPDEIDHIIPANDDAIRSIKLIVSKMADAMIEGGGGVSEGKEETTQQQPETKKPEQKRPAPRREDLKKKVESRPQKPTPVKREAEIDKEAKTAVEKSEELSKDPKAVKVEPKKGTPRRKSAPVKDEKVAPAEAVTVSPEPSKAETSALEEQKLADDLENKTVPELKQLAKDKGLSGYSKLKKAELIEALRK